VSANVPDASQGTCNWILEHDAYKSWLETPSQQFLWITGKAGSGKSTMMKYMVEHHRLQQASSQVVAHYFFRFGTYQSTTSLLSSLLYQLLRATPTWRTFDIFSSFIEKREYEGSDNTWDNDILTESLIRLADKSTALGDSLFFFIDGLDECDDPDMVINFLQQLNTSSPTCRIRICISSRPSNSLMPMVEIQMEDNNSSDIQTYLWKRLVALEDHLPPALDVEKTTQALTEKAQGMFLWASLMVSHLSSDSCLEAFKTEKHFTPWLPTDLEAAYETILRRLWGWNDRIGRKATQDALILVLCAQRELSLLELQSALATTQTHWGASNEIHDKQEKVPLSMTAQLMILGGGLLELTPWASKSTNDMSSDVKPTVHFIHSTVGRFLLERASCALEYDDCYFESTCSKGSQDSRELQLSDSRGRKERSAQYHLRVAWICLTYVNALGTRFRFLEDKVPTSSAPFLSYSLSFGMLHLSLADQMGVTPVTENMWQFPPFQKEFVEQWSALHGQIFKDQMLFKPHKTKAVHIMSYYGFPWYDSGLWGSKLTDINDEDHYGRTPLSLAAAMGHLDICEILILEGADMSHREHIYGQTPLSFAVAHGHQSIVELLLRKGSDYDDHISGVTPLWLACRRSNLTIAKRLLEAGANPNATSTHTGESCLSRAATFGRVSVTHLLLEHGAKVDTCDKTGWTALHHAVSRGRKKTIEVLLSYLDFRQLRQLIVSFSNGRSKGSWVTAVLSAIILSICRQRGGESQTTSDCNRSTQRPIGTAGRRFSKKPALNRHKRKLEGESDEDDYEENEEGTPGKKARRLDPSRRRFACPYHKRNESRFSSGECNKTGFTDIYRVK
jgi:ankyrin repeat protein/energy-coupling factor transporter ATP-binding protein EcfA2